jgi:deoxyribodipyrimidine photo-lyase
VIPVFVWDQLAPAVDTPEQPAWRMGEAQKWWLHHSLGSLEVDLRSRGSRLIIREGDTARQLSDLARDTGARAVYWSRRFAPAHDAADRRISSELESVGILAHFFGGSLLHNPDEIRTKGDTPYRVFTPFYRRFLELVEVGRPLVAPRRLAEPEAWPASAHLADLKLLPRPNWAERFTDVGSPGEHHAREQLHSFADENAEQYQRLRDAVGLDLTSKLSPRLALGELSPRQIWWEIQTRSPDGDGRDSYLRQLVWREFSYHVLVANPESDHKPLRREFRDFDWVEDESKLEAWHHGRTGYPIVDAAMRQLWSTGWMHNRARMIVASFLTKHLRIHWLHGARWFWDTLVDADLANNTMGWQWSAGSGADAQPYFRVFNPTLQARKFDSDGTYTRTWVPELGRLPTSLIHEPWKASPDVLDQAGVILGSTYPRPIVDHAQARESALKSYREMRQNLSNLDDSD